MVLYAFNNDGLPIYDAAGRNVLIVAGNAVNQDGRAVARDANGDPINGAGAAIPQPTLGVRLRFLIDSSVAAHPFAGGAGPAAALAPARVSRNPIDYSTRTGAALYDRATKSVFVDPKNQYDLDSATLMNFLDAISRRSRECGWDIFTIANTAGDNKNLLTEYGDLTCAEVMTHATVILGGAGIDRAAQEEAQLFACINNSLTQGAIDVLNLHESKFLIAATNEYSGTCYLRVIIAEAQVDTRATTNLLLGQLTSGLPDIMAKKGGNVKAFNQEVKSIIRRVKRRGTDPGSILPQLLRVYTAIDDKDGKFARYIENLNNNYIDGTIALDDTVLMTKAEAKYEELVEDDQFEIKNAKDDTIVALQTQIEALTTEMSNYKKPKSGGSDGGTAKDGKRRKGVPTWMTKAPKDGEPKSKKVEGRNYHWCEGYGAHEPRWVIHKVEKCRGYIKRLNELGGNQERDEDEEESTPTPPRSESTRETQRRVGWSTTMLAQVGQAEPEE
jgi:hypothetical protein